MPSGVLRFCRLRTIIFKVAGWPRRARFATSLHEESVPPHRLAAVLVSSSRFSSFSPLWRTARD